MKRVLWSFGVALVCFPFGSLFSTLLGLQLRSWLAGGIATTVLVGVLAYRASSKTSNSG